MNTTAPIVLPGPHDSAAHFVSAPTMTMRDLGPGEPILGHPTHRYSFTESYVAQTTLFDQPCKRTVNSVELIWTATDLPREEKLRRYVFDARPPTGTPLGYVNDSLARIRLHRERLVNGFLLRSESSITRPGAHGTNTTTKITMEVSELAHGPVPRSLFAVPDGFTLTGRAVPAAIRTRAESAALRERRAKVNSQVSERMHAIMCDP
jgi:hypothetical protein